jgi:hypothetical protein
MQAGAPAQRVRMIAQRRISGCDAARQDLSMLWIAGTGLGGVIVASVLLQFFY